METKTRKTPVTDAVRDQGGDYLALVEALEESHAALLEALQRLVAAWDADYAQVPNMDVRTAYETNSQAFAQARAALAQARPETTQEANRG